MRQGAGHCKSGAKQGCGDLGGEAVWDRRNEVCVGEGILLQCAGNVSACVLLVGTVVFEAAFAGVAFCAGVVEPFESDALTNGCV